MKRWFPFIFVLSMVATASGAAPTTQPVTQLTPPPLTSAQIAALPDALPLILATGNGKTLVLMPNNGAQYQTPQGPAACWRMSNGASIVNSGVTIECNGCWIFCPPVDKIFRQSASHLVVKDGRFVCQGGIFVYVRGTLGSYHHNTLVGSITNAIKTDLGGTGCNFSYNDVCVTDSVGAYLTQDGANFTFNYMRGSKGEYDLRGELDLKGHKPTGFTINNNRFESKAPFGKPGVGFRMVNNVNFSDNAMDGSYVLFGQSPTPNTITSPKYANAGCITSGNAYYNIPHGFVALTVKSGCTVTTTDETFVNTPGAAMEVDSASILTYSDCIQRVYAGAKVPGLTSATPGGAAIDNHGHSVFVIK